MSFISLKKDVLLQVAEDKGVELEENANKEQIIAALSETGYSWQDYKQDYPDPEDLPVVEEKTKEEPVDKVEEPVVEESAKGEEKVLVKMIRGNQRYEVRGYTFLRMHPFLPVDRADADYILNNVFGFRVATPEEVESFYS